MSGWPHLMLLWMSAVETSVHIKSNMKPTEVPFKGNWS
jgi:hypothetical protein